MKTALVIFLLIVGLCFASKIGAQAPAQDILPPGPWIKRSPARSQWLITYGSPAGTKPVPGEPNSKKTVVVAKFDNVLQETTGRQDGSVNRLWRTPGLAFKQAGQDGPWISTPGGEDGFNETTYTDNDFAGFNWLSKQNYIGQKAIANEKFLIFKAKVLTMDQQQLAMIRSEVQQKVSDWETEQLRKKENGKSPEKVAKPTASPSTTPSTDTRPPDFHVEDYYMEVEAVVNATSGMPLTLTYDTFKGPEVRTYTFQAPPSSLTLPPGAQALFDLNQKRLKRLSSPGASP